MVSIRCGVFETNSSSSHSICIRNSQSKPIVDVDVENIRGNLLNGYGVWKIKESDVCFGRSPFRFLARFSEKVLYAIANGIDIKDIERIVKKYVSGFVSFNFVDADEDSVYYAYGYTDDRILPMWLSKHNISLEDFLIHSNYSVICDGDEYCIFNDMVKLGIVSKNTDGIKSKY